MEKTLLLKLFTLLALLLCCSVTSSSSSAKDNLINVSKLKMFVDELPKIPRILGYKVVNGVPKSKSLKIGMFKKKWVCAVFLFVLCSLIQNLHVNLRYLFCSVFLYHVKLFLCLFSIIANMVHEFKV
jgi:hypothetical protein